MKPLTIGFSFLTFLTFWVALEMSHVTFACTFGRTKLVRTGSGGTRYGRGSIADGRALALFEKL